MLTMVTALVRLFVLFIPAYVANGAPVLLGGGCPVDLGKRFIDGRKLLGNSKTVRGLIAGIITGFAAGAVLGVWHTHLFLFNDRICYALAGLLEGVGAMVGDMTGSFIKRRLNLKEGDPAPIMDELGFLIMATVFLFPILSQLTFTIEVIHYFLVLIITYVLHKSTNFLANRIGLKKVPW